MDENAVREFQSISGLGSDEATMWLEMSGGDLGSAIELFFGSAGGGGDFGGNMEISHQADDIPDYLRILFPSMGDIPNSWLEQGIHFNDNESLGIKQLHNGPCGVLAVLQAIIFSLKTQYSDPQHIIVHTLSQVLRQCNDSGTVKIAKWESEIGKKIVVEDVSKVEEYLFQHLSDFTNAGGLLLLVFSVLLTRTVEQIRSDIASGSGEPPLIVGSNWLCSFELVSLFMRGNANGNIGAYNIINTSKSNDWNVPFGFGMLSASFEEQNRIPLCNSLKSPKLPIWILHGTDHFTTLYSPEPLPDNGILDHHIFHHWNGLHPGGPRLAKLCISAPDGSVGPAPESPTDVFYQPIPGTIDSVVQVDKELKEKFPEDLSKWKYEVVLTFDDPDVHGEERPAGMEFPPVFPQGELTQGPWRCSRCYNGRFKTMCFGQNPAEAVSCTHCGLYRAECGWSIWLEYSKLPKSWQSKMQRRYGPRILALLSTKWPNLSIEFEENLPIPSV